MRVPLPVAVDVALPLIGDTLPVALSEPLPVPLPVRVPLDVLVPLSLPLSSPLALSLLLAVGVLVALIVGLILGDNGEPPGVSLALPVGVVEPVRVTECVLDALAVGAPLDVLL